MRPTDNPLHHEQEEPNHAADASKALIDSLMVDLMRNATKPALNELKDLGQINKIDLPGGWKNGTDYNNGQHSATYKEFHPAAAPDCQLGFYYRGHRTSESAGCNFHNLLQKPPHNLSEQELKSLGEIVRDKANPKDFTATSARTEDLNGKRVLMIEGEYTASKQVAKHMFIDSDGTGTAVQEVFFQADSKQYPKYSPAASDAMKSIKWK